MKKLYFLFGFLFLLNYSYAQDEAVYNHYHLNHMLVNPAATGMESLHRVHLNARAAWVGFGEGSPTTYSLAYNGAVGKQFGLGAMIFSENVASLSRTRGQLNYAFRFEFPDFKLGVGFSTEFENESIPASVMTNMSYDEGDMLIESLVDGRMRFDASFGVFSRIKEKTYVGLSFLNLISSRIGDISEGGEESNLLSFYTFTAGHKFVIEGLDFQIEPSLMIRKVRNVQSSLIDFNVKADFLEERITTGLSYRSGTGGALGILLGTKINAFRIYYTYDVYFGAFQRYSSGSHELTASFEFGGKGKDRAEEYR